MSAGRGPVVSGLCVFLLDLGGIRFLCDSPGLTVEWTEDDLQQGKRISVPQDVYDKGCVKDVDEGLEVNAEPVGARGGPEPNCLCPGSSWQLANL